MQVDRVYLSSSGCVAVLDHERKRTYVIKKEGLPDIGNPLSLNFRRLLKTFSHIRNVEIDDVLYHATVVWNPWEKKAKAMVDFGDDEYKHMLCVDPAAMEKPITLKPGEEWTGRMEITVVPSSFCSDDLDSGRLHF